MTRPSYMQMQILAQFLEDHPDIAKGHLRSAHARHITKLKWQEIAVELNDTEGPIKTPKAWAKVWADKKYILKKLVAKRQASAANPSGCDIPEPIMELDERLIALMGRNGYREGNQEHEVPLLLRNVSFYNISEEERQPIKEEAQDPLPEEANSEHDSMSEEAPDPVPEDHKPVPSTSQHASSPPMPEILNRIRVVPITPTNPSRNPPIRVRRLPPRAQERLMAMQDRRVQAELQTAASWTKIAEAIDNHAKAILIAADKIAEALNKSK